MSACPKCAHHESEVTHTTKQDNGLTQRRRVCSSCGFRFNTVELFIDRFSKMQEVADAIGSLKRMILADR